MPERIHIAACCDENYVAYATVMMLSALTASPGRPLHFHLINCGISSASVASMQAAVARGNGTLTIYEPDETLFSGLPTHRYGSAVYQRINLPEYVPADIHRLIYIDSDTLVQGDLAYLWTLDLQGQPVAAVENLSPKACLDINLPRQAYFNSGVLVMDLDLWRREGIHHQVTDYAKANAAKLEFVDQCSLNAILHKRWLRLPVNWNQQSDIFKVILKYAEGCSYSVPELESGMWSPAIVHFTGKKKPWKIYCFHPFKYRYRAVLAKTPWAGKPAPDDDLTTRLKFITAFRQNWKCWQRTRHISPIGAEEKDLT
ncbi:MAG: glycosyltransferase family 8 protein [Marinobacter sp.]|nr:glycosyltransferase family 8 protein [Marinobacter sp.]